MRLHEGGVGEDARVVLPRLDQAIAIERLPSKTDGPAVGMSQAVWPNRYWMEHCERAQVEVVRAEVGRRPRGGAAERRISVACNAGSITPATLDAALS